MAILRRLTLETRGSEHSAELPFRWLCAPRHPELIVGFLAVVMFLVGLGQNSMANVDEAIYAQVSKEMVQSGDWMIPRYEYKVWIDKPPLFMWVTAAFFKLFGVNEFWARAASAFSGVGLVIVSSLVGTLIYDGWVGLLTGLLLLMSRQLVAQARFGTLDVMLAFLMTIGVYAFLRLKDGSPRWWLVLGAALGCGVLTKSFAGLVTPAAMALALALDGQLGTTVRSKYFWLAVALAVIIILPWHLFMLLHFKQDFITHYFLYNTVGYITEPLDNNAGSWLYYVDVLRFGFYPWSYLAPIALLYGASTSRRAGAQSHVLVFIVVLVFGVFSLAQTKLPWYMVQLYPALAILTAMTLVRVFRTAQPLVLGGLVLGAALVAVSSTWKVLVFCLSLALLALLAARLGRVGSNKTMTVALFVACAILSGANMSLAYQKKYMPDAKLAQVARATQPDDREPLLLYPAGYNHPYPHLWRPTSLFYSNRPIYEVNTFDELAHYMQNQQTGRAIVAINEAPRLSNLYTLQVVAEASPYMYVLLSQKQFSQE